MSIFSIYKIENKVNGKVYIGKQSSPSKIRWDYHKWAAKAGKKTRLSDAIREFGEDGFSLEVLFECDDESEIKEKEIFYIKQFRSDEEDFGYNMTCGSQGGLKWTLQEAKDCAEKYKTRTEWARKHPNSYDVAHYHGWIEECSRHMPIPKRYSDDEIRGEAAKYLTPNEWKIKGRGTYEAARARGIRESIVSEMLITKISAGAPILVDGVFYKNAHTACTKLDLNHGNMAGALCGKRASVGGHTVRYVTQEELSLYVDDADRYDPSIFKRKNKERERLILGIPIVNKSGSFCGIARDVAVVECVGEEVVSLALRKTGQYRGYRYATEEDLVRENIDPLRFRVFFVKKFPGFLPQKKKRQKETSTLDS
jgi:group I intron endonuclease